MGEINRIFLGTYRFILFLSITAYYVWPLAYKISRKKAGYKEAQLCLVKWAHKVQRALGIHCEVSGNITCGKVIYVANHRSYIDGVLICALTGSFFVIKDEARKWPIIGSAIKATRNILVNRESSKSRIQSSREILARLEEGFPVTVFAEGTTHKGPGCEKLMPGVFKLSVRLGVPVVPIALEYKNEDDAWIGKSSFINHFIKCIGKGNTHIRLRMGSTYASTDPQYLSTAVSGWIDLNSREMRSEFQSQEFSTSQNKTDTPHYLPLLMRSELAELPG